MEFVPAAIHGGVWPQCYSLWHSPKPITGHTGAAKQVFLWESLWITSSKGRAMAVQSSLFTDRGQGANGRDRWLCHAQQQDTDHEGAVTSHPSARGYCPPCKTQGTRAGADVPVCHSLQPGPARLMERDGGTRGGSAVGSCIPGRKAAQMALKLLQWELPELFWRRPVENRAVLPGMLCCIVQPLGNICSVKSSCCSGEPVQTRWWLWQHQIGNCL